MRKAPKLDIPAYRRNIRAACKALRCPVPSAYSTAIAPNGDFIVRNAMGEVVGRLPSFEPFTR